MEQEKKQKKSDRILAGLFVFFLAGFGIWNIFRPKDAYSMEERRPLAKFPAVTGESLLSGSFMTDFESYSQDQFAGRNVFRSIKAGAESYLFKKLDNNGIYMADGYLSAMQYPLHEKALEEATQKFNEIAEEYLTEENHGYLAVIPDKNYYLADKNNYLSMDYDVFYANIKEQTPSMTFLDLRDQLGIEDYYKTDTHWKQENLIETAAFLAKAMDLDLIPKENEYHQVIMNTSFYGVYAGQSALSVQPDTLICLDNELLRQCTVYDYENQREIDVYNLDASKGKDPYEVYLSGSLSLLTIENPSGDTGKELILFRDSFGSSLAPLLMEYYDKITLVDIRYLPVRQLEKYVKFTNQDVLFLYSTLVLNQEGILK